MIQNIPGFEHAYVAQISDELAVRVSRGIEGEVTFDKDERVVHGAITSDAVSYTHLDVYKRQDKCCVLSKITGSSVSYHNPLWD